MIKAYTKYRYGGPEVLQLEEIEKPSPKEDQILVKVKANSANPADWHIMRGNPFLARLSFGLFKPKVAAIGADFAGVVEEIGSNVENFKVGDRVFGESLYDGAFGEYVAISEAACAKMPDSASFKRMAAVPVAGLTALQALVTHAKLQEGESILINDSSGGAGHFSVQNAKALGAHVTGVCSKRNTEFVRSLGADEVIAYDEVKVVVSTPS